MTNTTYIANCPECQHPMEEKEWTNAYATADGEAAEESGVAMYCTNDQCFYHLNPVDNG